MFKIVDLDKCVHLSRAAVDLIGEYQNKDISAPDYFASLPNTIYSCAGIIGNDYMKYVRGEITVKPNAVSELESLELLSLWLGNIDKFNSK